MFFNPESSICKCEHGVYICAGSINGKALYCQICTPGGPNDQREVVLPRNSADSLTSEGRVMANHHSGSGCPQFGSAVWMRTQENGSDSRRECAECGVAYSVRLSIHQQAQQMLSEMEAECSA
jgi:hypothetical protein